MVNEVISNLHKSIQGFGDNALLTSLKGKIEATLDRIGSKLPNFIGAELASKKEAIKKIKKDLLKKLDKKRKKFRLALESLGWGTLADLLDAALCGEKLNIII